MSNFRQQITMQTRTQKNKISLAPSVEISKKRKLENLKKSEKKVKNDQNDSETEILTPRKKFLTSGKNDSPTAKLQKAMSIREDKLTELLSNFRPKSQKQRDEIIKLALDVNEMQTNLYAKSFSKWKYEEVKKLFDLENIPSSQFVEDACKNKVVAKHAKIAKAICSIWKDKINVMGPLNTGPELQRNLFIGDLLCLSLAKLKIKATLRIEAKISSIFANGPVEFVVVSIDRKSVLLIVEAKRDDIDEGRAQLLMQLYGSLKHNTGFNIFGFVSNAASWTPIVYTKDRKFFEGETLSVSPLKPKSSEIAAIVRLVEFMTNEGRTFDITEDDEESELEDTTEGSNEESD
jgi:hypothetical protein